MVRVKSVARALTVLAAVPTSSALLDEQPIAPESGGGQPSDGSSGSNAITDATVAVSNGSVGDEVPSSTRTSMTSPNDADVGNTATTTTDSAITTASAASSISLNTSAVSTPSFCEARTINYITHVLPQFCLTNSWTSPIPTQTENPSQHNATSTETVQVTTSPSEQATATDDEAATESVADQPASTFMSFEDWKEMMLRRAGQDPQELRTHKHTKSSDNDDKIPPDAGHAGLGEEGEISLDFGQYAGGGANRDDSAGGTAVDKAQHENGDSGLQEILTSDGTVAIHRNKDAGRTCKERFSYASFDAGATILKTSKGAKNAKAILVENKDSYLLLECATPDKYVIVELSDDIMIDTIVLANFEFFSSMIRHFRVSVSDRYPVKADKWREIGLFEARNSRDIQAFLVENPQIWAKYVKVDFVTQYGKEFYCPVSLLRVHGSRMLDSWKDSRDEDGDDDEAIVTASIPEIEASHGRDLAQQHPETLQETPWHPIQHLDHFASFNETCDAANPPPSVTTPIAKEDHEPIENVAIAQQQTPPHQQTNQTSSHTNPERETPPEVPSSTPPVQSPPTPSTPSDNRASQQAIVSSTNKSSNNINTNATSNSEANANSTASAPPKVTTPMSAGAGAGKNRTTGSAPAGAPAPPQEGFFHAITKRLQQVEANLTLSLKYVEDQSRHVQEALQRVEQKQLSRVSLFLQDLNSTVLSEMRNVREQYDQIWQSTVLALESQRDQSERDIVALSTRLNLLADEVVFQKRMAIVQAVLLLSCLFLVIFSRGVPIPYLAPLMDQSSSSPFMNARLRRARDSPPYGPPLDLSREDEDQSPHRAPSQDISSQIRRESSQKGLTEGFSTAPDDATQSHPPSEWERLSPPLTPSMRPTPLAAEGPVTNRNPRSFSLSKPPGSQFVDSRKPLPSLPEHPGATEDS